MSGLATHAICTVVGWRQQIIGPVRIFLRRKLEKRCINILRCAKWGAVGKPDPIYGELVIAFVALYRAEATDAGLDLREFARERLADYKVPERILLLPELPKGLTGKVDRRALNEVLLAEARAAGAY